MNKNILAGLGIFAAIIIALLSVSLTGVNAQSIITGNSNSNITQVSYDIDIAPLGLSDYLETNYYNDTNTTIITNTTNTVEYTCTLNVDGNNYVRNGLSPTLVHYEVINETLSQEIGEGLYLTELNCSYYINITTTVTNITLNNTVVDTFLFLNTTKIDSQKTIIVDYTSPIIALNETNITLYNNTNYTDISSIDISINDLSEMNCSINITQNITSSIYNFIQNSSSVSLPINITGPISFNTSINYSVNGICSDILGNIGNINSWFPIYNYSIDINTSNNNSNSSNATNITATPFISLSLSKQEFSLGEIGYYTINALNGSNVTVTICPIATGWVQCFVTPTFVNDTYPKTQALPYTNKTGLYVVTSVVNYQNYTNTTNATYTTLNTLVASISVNPGANKIGEGDTVIYNSTASSGVGTYKYRWLMHDGSIFNGPGAFKVYATAGTYRVNLSVNDTAGNNYTTYLDVTVREYNTLSVVVSDKATNARISGVFVKIGNQTLTTDNSGVATFTLLSDDYAIKLTKENYQGASYSVELDEDMTAYLNMTFQDLSSPTITLLTSNNEIMSKNTVDLKFKADDSTVVDCKLYIAKSNDSWYELKDSGDNLLTNTDYTFELRDLDNGGYKWKIECSDSNENTAYSEERKFVVSDGSVAIALNAVSSSSDEINKALDNMNKLSDEESKVAEIMGIKSELKDLLDRINTYDRDINDMAYRRDLGEEGRLQAQKDLTESIEYRKYNTPINIEVENSKTFVKYVRDDDLSLLLEEYASLKNMKIDKKLFFESTKLAQSKIIVSTNVRNVKLYYLSGEMRDITLVTRDIQIIKPEDEPAIKNSNSITFIEVIPKSILQTAKEINFLTKEYDILKDDPLIEYPSDTKIIAYYINETIDPEKFQDSDTVLVEKNTFTVKSGTGFSIFGISEISEVELTGQNAMIILIVLLVLFYIVVNFDLIEKVRGYFSKIGLFGSGKRVSFIKVLINDAQDYLKNEDYDKASLIYREIKLSYEEANDYVRKQVYDESFELCNELDFKYALRTLDRAESYIKSNDRNNALMEFDKLEKTYNKLSDDYRIKIHDKFKKLSDMMIGTNKY